MVKMKQLRVHIKPNIKPNMEAVYVDEHTSEDLVNHNIRPQGLADEEERIHSIVDEMEAED